MYIFSLIGIKVYNAVLLFLKLSREKLSAQEYGKYCLVNVKSDLTSVRYSKRLHWTSHFTRYQKHYAMMYNLSPGPVSNT